MKTCSNCKTTYDDNLAACPSCSVHIAATSAPRGDESVSSIDTWGANDSNPPQSHRQATQELVPREAPIKKVVTRKSTKDAAKFNGTILGVPSGSQSTAAMGTPKSDLDPTRKLGKAKKSPPKTVRQPTLVLGEEEPAVNVPLSLDPPKTTSENDPSMGVKPLSSSPGKAAWEIDTLSADIETGKKVEILVQSETEIDFSPDPVDTLEAFAEEQATPRRVGALSRDDDDRFFGRSQEETALPRSSRQQRRQPARPGAMASPALSVSLGISSAILISTWLIPDVFSGVPVFPFNLVASTHGSDLVALLTEPTCGALLLALILLPISPRLQATVSLALGLLALGIPLLLGSLALPLPGPTVLAIACINIAVAVLIFVVLRVPILGHFALLLVPGVLFATSIFGVVSGRLPAAHLSLFKAPLNIYAAMLITGLATTALIGASQNKRAKT